LEGQTFSEEMSTTIEFDEGAGIVAKAPAPRG
jgi:hypothetical protein